MMEVPSLFEGLGIVVPTAMVALVTGAMPKHSIAGSSRVARLGDELEVVDVVVIVELLHIGELVRKDGMKRLTGDWWIW